MARKKKTYKDYINKTADEIKELPRRKRRLPAMAMYIQNFDMSVQEISDLLDIPYGTIKDWAEKDEWTKTRNQIKDNIKESIINTAQTKHAQQLNEAITNLIYKFVEASNSEMVQIMEAKDIKALIDSIEKAYKIFGDLNILQQQTQKHEIEHKGKVEHDHDISKYEEHMNKFNDMLDKVLPQDNEEEDNEE